MKDPAAATSLIDKMPATAKTLFADKGCDTDEIHEELKKKKVEACTPSKANRKEPIPHDEENACGGRRSRGCSDESRIGGASPCATTDAMTC